MSARGWAAGAAIALGAAMFVGAMLAGHSVRASASAALARGFGRAAYSISAPRFFRPELAASLELAGPWQTCPIVAVEGTVLFPDSGREAPIVQVYGIDAGFWAFQGLQAHSNEGAWLSAGLQEQSGGAAKATLRVRKPGAAQDVEIPLAVAGGMPADFSVVPNQRTVHAVLAPLSALQAALGEAGQVNAILIASSGKRDESRAIAQALRERAMAEDLGLRVEDLGAGEAAVTFEGGAFPERLLEQVEAACRRLGVRTSARAVHSPAGIRGSGGQAAEGVTLEATDEIDEGTVVMDTRTARELRVAAGDTVDLAAGENGVPVTARVARVARTAGSDAAALVSLADGRALWGNGGGFITEIHAYLRSDTIEDEPPLDALRFALHAQVDPTDLGFSVRSFARGNLDAARTPADFFLPFSGIPILAAFLLAGELLSGLPLRERTIAAAGGAFAGTMAAFAWEIALLGSLNAWWPDAVGGISISPKFAAWPALFAALAAVGLALLCSAVAGWAGRTGKRNRLAVGLLAAASFVLVGAGRYRAFPAPSPGYTAIAETRAPVDRLPASPGIWYPFRLRSGEDISRRNPFVPQEPRIAGASAAFLSAWRGEPWSRLSAPIAADGAIPALVDGFSLRAVLHRKTGDVLTLFRWSDHPVRLRVMGAIHDPALQSEVIVSEENFRRAFPFDEGRRFFLVNGAGVETIRRALAGFGAEVKTAEERIRAYHEVDHDYVSMFQVLASAGFLLGCAAFALGAGANAGWRGATVQAGLAVLAGGMAAAIWVAVAGAWGPAQWRVVVVLWAGVVMAAAIAAVVHRRADDAATIA